jgi:hypothetical protein
VLPQPQPQTQAARSKRVYAQSDAYYGQGAPVADAQQQPAQFIQPAANPAFFSTMAPGQEAPGQPQAAAPYLDGQTRGNLYQQPPQQGGPSMQQVTQQFGQMNMQSAHLKAVRLLVVLPSRH